MSDGQLQINNLSLILIGHQTNSIILCTFHKFIKHYLVFRKTWQINFIQLHLTTDFSILVTRVFKPRVDQTPCLKTQFSFIDLQFTPNGLWQILIKFNTAARHLHNFDFPGMTEDTWLSFAIVKLELMCRYFIQLSLDRGHVGYA